MSQGLIWSKSILIAILAFTLLSFWYFETSLILKILVTVLSLSGLLIGLFRKIEKPPVRSPREFIILLVLYLGLFAMYNLLYGLSIPLYLVMLAILLFVCGLFYGLLTIDRLETIISPPLFWVFIVLTGLITLQVFLSLSFWPIDPKVKSLIIVIVFYLNTNLIYLFSHNVLKLKKIIGVLIISVIILSILILNIWFSFKGAI